MDSAISECGFDILGWVEEGEDGILTITVVSKSAIIREAIAYTCRDNGLLISGMYDSYTGLTRANFGEVFLIHVDDLATDLSERVRALTARYADVRVVALVPDTLPGALHDDMAGCVDAIVSEAASADKLIATLRQHEEEAAAQFSERPGDWAGPPRVDPKAPPAATVPGPQAAQPPAITPQSPEPATDADVDLTDRESMILGHLCAGHPNKMIARSLHISDATVKVHLRTVFRKIGVSNRTQAALWASRHLDPALVANCPGSVSQNEDQYEDTVGHQRRGS